MKILRVGISGLGRSGWWNHLVPLLNLRDRFVVTAVQDSDVSRMREAVDLTACRCHDSYTALINDPEVDLVAIATPSHLHCEQAVEALRAGKMVVLEKPMATDLAEAQTIADEVQRSGAFFTVFHIDHYSSDFQQVLRVIRSGCLGRIVEIRSRRTQFARRWDWQTLRKYGGGALNNTGPHAIEHALVFLDGQDKVEVFCHADRTVTLGDAEDHLKIILRKPGHPLIDIEISAADAWAGERWAVLGTQGGLRGTRESLNWKYFDPKALPARSVVETSPGDRRYDREEIPWQEESWNASGKDDLGALFYLDLHKRWSAGLSPEIDARRALEVMSIVATCRRALPE